MIYRQRNDGIVWFFAAVLSLVLLVLWLNRPFTERLWPALLPLLGILGLLALTLSSLSVSVNGGMLSVWMGPGLMRQQVKVTEIVQISEVTINSPFAVGVRWMVDGWLYSLGGADFVQLDLANGRRLLIGAEQQPDLADELRRWCWS